MIRAHRIGVRACLDGGATALMAAGALAWSHSDPVVAAAFVLASLAGAAQGVQAYRMRCGI